MTRSLQSRLYEGTVRHRRFLPVENSFSYRLYMVYLDLAELPELFDGRFLWSARRPAVAWFRREDHVGDPAEPLDESVRSLVAEQTGRRPQGPIRLLTHLRYFGYCFNPVSFYYCFDPSGSQVETIVAEVSNTPWKERHCYVLPATASIGSDRTRRFRFAKDFHVSPFMQMDVDYDWRFTDPTKRLTVHMENLDGPRRVFDATMTLKRQPISGTTLASTLVRHPVMTGEVIAKIYWQALRLWLKRARFYPHPKHQIAPGRHP